MVLFLLWLALKRTVTVILITFGQVNLYDSLLLNFLELIHCVVLELVFLPNRFLQKGEMSRYYAM